MSSSSPSTSSSSSSLPRRFQTVRKHGKPLPAPAREVVANVRNFLRTESVINPKIPLKNFRQRAIDAVGISEHLYRNIMKEADKIQRGEMKRFKTPTRLPLHKPTRVMNLENTKSIRDVIYNFYVNEKRPPTITSLMTNIEKDNIPFYGSKTTLWRLMRKLGFRWTTTTNDRVLIESDEIRYKRINYLKQISEYRELERPIIYLDERSMDNSYLRQLQRPEGDTNGLKKLNYYNRRLIVIYAGGEMGLLPNSLVVSMSECDSGYDFNINKSKIFSKWLERQLLPILPPRSVLIIDNNTYQSINIEDVITTKTDMIEWLQKRNLSYNVGMTKAELYAIIKSYKSENPTCKLDELLKKYGCSVLRLPPHHPELNAGGLVWNNIKDYIVTQRIHQMKEIKDLLQEKFDSITTQNDWQQFCGRIKIVEKEYLERENVFDKITDDLEIILQHHNDDCEEDNEVIDETMEIEELSDNEFEENRFRENRKIKSETIESIGIKQEQFSDDEMNNWKPANFVQIKNEVHTET